MEAKAVVEEKAQMMQNIDKDGSESSVKQTVAEMKGIPTEQQLTEMLQNQILEVTFLKLNGDRRVMTCTKVREKIPEQYHPKGQKSPKAGTVNVWDVNAQGYRSFRYDRVQAVKEV